MQHRDLFLPPGAHHPDVDGRCPASEGPHRVGDGRGRLIDWVAGIDDLETAGFFRLMADESLEDATRLLNAIDEHAHVMQLVMEAGVASTSLVTLQRALIEAVLTLCYVHDADAAPARTMLRILARQLDAFKGSERNSAAFPRSVIGDRAAEIRGGVEGFRAMLVRYGVELTPLHKGSTPSLAYDGHRENVVFNATDAAKRYLKADGTPLEHGKRWHSLEGVVPTERAGRAHGREAVEQSGAVRRANVRGARVGTGTAGRGLRAQRDVHDASA
jgi:hypothetical protein